MQQDFVLVWAPPERDLEIRICVQVVYSGDDGEGGRRENEAEKRMKTMKGLLSHQRPLWAPESTPGELWETMQNLCLSFPNMWGAGGGGF